MVTYLLHWHRRVTSILLILCAALFFQACAISTPAVPAASDPTPTLVVPASAAEPVPLALPDCSFAQGRAPQVASYCMNVRLDPAAKTVAGVERITYRNPSQDSLNEIWLRLYLRAFRDDTSIWMRETGGQLRDTRFDPEAPGDITVSRLALAGGADLLASATLTDTLMRVPLPEPLAPGQRLDLDVSWTSKLPRVFARTGYGGHDDTFFMVGQWYPKMAVYDSGRWDTEPWHGNSEFFADFGGYDVTIAAPKEYIVAGVGTPAGDASEQAGARIVRYTAADVTDFAFAASPDFKIEAVKAGDAEVVLYYLPEHRSAICDYMQSATGSLQAYSNWYGAYPHPRLTVVDVPSSAAGAGGMEYPTLITGGDFGAATNSGFLGYVVAHEVGHQWWPMQTATDEAREPWLDEGLTEYSSVRYLAEATRNVADHGQADDVPAFEKALYNGSRKPATLPAWKYTASDYGSAVYGKTALGLWMLESVVGTERLRAAMADYLAQYRFKHPTGADFRNALEHSLGEQRWFFDDYLNGEGVVDYNAETIQISASGSTVQVSREGTVRVPVDIRITLADGTQQLKHWDGQASAVSFTFSVEPAVRKVEVDPEHKLRAEIYTINNTISAKP